jgi:hypothetical protein
MPMPGSHFQSAVLPRAVRELSDAEKVSLARSLPVNFKEPNSAKFRWLPVAYEPGGTQVEYCGLVNAKSPFGAYAGYRAFHAVLQADPRGQFTNGIIDHPKSGLDWGAKATGDALMAAQQTTFAGARVTWISLKRNDFARISSGPCRIRYEPRTNLGQKDQVGAAARNPPEASDAAFPSASAL